MGYVEPSRTVKTVEPSAHALHVVASAPYMLDDAHLVEDLERVDNQLTIATTTHSDMPSELLSQLISAGGKRIRPGFCVTSSKACSLNSKPATFEAVLGATAVELVHMGSLYHDDVMDEATTRRSVASVNAKWGNLRAILAGDYLLGKASEIAASLGAEVAKLLATTITQLCEGQILEQSNLYNTNRTEEQYERSIAGKTAALLATSCRIGAMVNRLPAHVVDSLESFGYSYGMAFQIIDDILDVVSTQDELGKPSGNDIAEGVYTLPVIKTLQDETVGSSLRALLNVNINAATQSKARQLILRTQSIQASHGVARTWADRSQASLSKLPATPATAVLKQSADHLINRIKTTSIF